MDETLTIFNKYTISLFWDCEACVWVATSEDIGLVLEHSSIETLMEKVRLAVPELLEIENRLKGKVFLDYVALKKEQIFA